MLVLRNRRFLFSILVVLVILLGTFLFIKEKKPALVSLGECFGVTSKKSELANVNRKTFAGYNICKYSFDGEMINLLIADTYERKMQGLSLTDSLPSRYGMLFIFDEGGRRKIWMKDMKYNIDIYWFDKNGQIIYMQKDVSPDTYPKTFSTEKSTFYILEKPS